MKSTHYIELVTNNGSIYFQVVRRKDAAILSAHTSLSCAADRLYKPTYEDGTPVTL